MKAGLTRALPVSTIICALLFSGFFTTALGQGMGKDQSGPVTVNKTQVSVEASINPSFLPSDTSNKTLFIRSFQTGANNNNATIPRLNYRVVVILGNSTLLDQRFSSSDGVVYANLVPDQGINGWLINGQSHPPSDQIPVSQSNPVKIKSKILSSGGQYHIVATIEKGSPGLNAESDLAFDLFISVSQEYDFNVRTLSGTEGFKVRSYNDIVTDLSLVPRNGTSGISIMMPFDWQSKYEPSVPLVHLEVEFPKAIAELQANSYQGTVNGVVIPQRSLLIDDFSIPQIRIVHVILPRPTLDLLSERINSELNVIHVVITPLISKPKFPIQIQSNPHGSYIFELSWGPVVIASGVQTNFVMDMINPQTGDTTGANFNFVISHNGTDVYRTPLSSGIGLYSLEYAFPIFLCNILHPLCT